MKKFMLAILSVVFLSASVCYANENFSVNEKVQKMKAELNLTDSQSDQIKPILEDYKNGMKQLREQKEQRLNQVLTSDQMNQWKRIMKDKKDGMDHD